MRATWKPALALAALGVLAYVRALGTFFAQDDFFWLHWAAGGDALPEGFPRFIGAGYYVRALHSAFGPAPHAFHAVGLALHVGTGLALFHLLRPRAAAGTAAAAAALFLTSPAVFDVVHWACQGIYPASTLLLGLALGLVAGPPAPRGEMRRWAALALYGLAALVKELAIGAALPLACIEWRSGGRAGRGRAALYLALAALLVLPWWLAAESSPGESYAMRPGAALANLPGYVAASVLGGLAWQRTSDLEWARSPLPALAGWALLVLWLAVLWRRGRAAAWLGLVWFAALLAPVVALGRQFYFYYGYAALPGLWASAALLVPAGPRSRVLNALAAVAVAVQVGAVEMRARATLAGAPLPADFVLRRARIARNAFRDLARHSERLTPSVVLVGQQPVETSAGGFRTTAAPGPPGDPYWDENVRIALSEGRAVLVADRRVEQAAFKPWPEAADSAAAILAYQIDGRLQVSSYREFTDVGHLPPGAGLTEHLELAARLVQRRLFPRALEVLVAADRVSPGNPVVRMNAGVLLAKLGDTAQAMTLLEGAVAVAPRDVDALYNLGLLQWRRGRREEARRTWARLQAEAPASDAARNVRALLAGEAR